MVSEALTVTIGRVVDNVDDWSRNHCYCDVVFVVVVVIVLFDNDWRGLIVLHIYTTIWIYGA